MLARKSVSCQNSLLIGAVDGSDTADGGRRLRSRMSMSSFRRAVRTARGTFRGWPPSTSKDNPTSPTSTRGRSRAIRSPAPSESPLQSAAPSVLDTRPPSPTSTDSNDAMPVKLTLLTPKPTLKTIISNLDNDLANNIAEPGLMPRKSIDPWDTMNWPTPPASAVASSAVEGRGAFTEWPSRPSSAVDKPQSAVEPSRGTLSIGPPTPTSAVDKARSAVDAGRGTFAVWPSPSFSPKIKYAVSVEKPEMPSSPPKIPEKSAARQSALVEMGEDLAYKLDQLRSDIKTLRHKSSFLDETLKQTVHHRLAVVAEIEAIYEHIEIPDEPADSAVSFLARPRPVSRARTSRDAERPFWEARVPSAMGMRPSLAATSSEESILSSAPELQNAQEARATCEAKKISVISAMPKKISALPKIRSKSTKRSVSLPRTNSIKSTAARMRTVSEGIQPGEHAVNVRDSTFDKIIDLWRRIGVNEGHFDEMNGLRDCPVAWEAPEDVLLESGRCCALTHDIRDC